MNIREIAGFAGGVLLSPLVAAGTLLRRSKLFHSEGVVYRAEVVPDAERPEAAEIGARLAGPALVRFSSGLWKGGRERRPDILGASVRFRSESSVTPIASPGDQDLLLATVRSSLTLLPALFLTRVESFLWDDYYAVGTFQAGEMGLIKIKLATPKIASKEMSRQECLDKATSLGIAILELEARRAGIGSRYERVARIRLLERVDIDQNMLFLSPFRTGRGIIPRGFLNALRIAPYAVGEALRPRRRAR